MLDVGCLELSSSFVLTWSCCADSICSELVWRLLLYGGRQCKNQSTHFRWLLHKCLHPVLLSLHCWHVTGCR
ncbi:hypothetical protein COO60DRAFT_1701165, partial [Scenedesmus sp. NREL 46B-D3]